MMQQLKEKIKTGKGKRHFLIYGILWVIMWVFLFGNAGLMIQDAENKHRPYYLVFLAMILFMVLMAVICTRLYLGWIRPEIKKRVNVWCFIALFGNSIYLFFMMEYVNNPIFHKMKFEYMLVNVLGIFIMTLIVLCWFNSVRRALLFMTIFYFVLTLVFYYVFICRGEPFQLIDIYSFSTAVEVAGSYKFMMTRPVVCCIVTGLGMYAFYMHIPDWNVAKKRPGKIAIRIIALVVMILGGIFFRYANWNGALNITTDLWKPKQTYEECGTTVGFFCVAKFMQLDAPKGYSVSETENFCRETEEEMAGDNPVKPVNIICIMNESWADYRLIGDLQTNEEVMPFYDSMKENTIKGYTLVNIQGGGTAKTEYEFLTGNSVKQYPGMVPYVSYFTHDEYSLVSTLEQQGYETAAMHPNKGGNWKRNTAYEQYGFDRFYTIDDFDENAEKYRGNISDQANYEKIIEVIESKEDPEQPFFLFDVTMQNHGGYTGNNAYQGEIEVQGINSESGNTFLSLERISDEALEYLITYFENYDQPTMIVMFGDHYPTLSSGFVEHVAGAEYDDLQLQQQEMYYATPYFIWANYDIEEAEDVMTSTNYLGTDMLKQTGLLMPAYNVWLAKQQEQIPAMNFLGYMDPSGEFHEWADADPEIADQVWKYECIQYNSLAETRKRLDWFFRLS